VLPIEANARRAATMAKQDLAQGAGGCSDHLALVRAYNGWAVSKRTGGHFRYASSMFLSNGTMTMIEGMRGQLLGELTVSLSLQDALPNLCILQAEVLIPSKISLVIPLSAHGQQQTCLVHIKPISAT